jgi:DNA-binding FadR family transcriptional regulator
MSHAPLLADRGGTTVAEQIERQLACEILRGDRGPDTRLPSVRALAAQFEVTVPTIQRVVARLEALGLVEARQGSGVRVLDPERHGGLSLMPLWFEALADQPERCARILGDFLEVRRVFATHLAARHRAGLMAVAPRLAVLAAHLAAASNLSEVVERDLAFTRTVLEASGNFAATRLFHTVERNVRETPYVAEALYGDTEAHRALMVGIATAMATELDADALAARLERAMAAYDASVVERFRALLDAGSPT